jgi:crotonobetainyl-CoA:carnitine CoA-transferase CaiB-like acyl-CoA transferase
VAAGVPALAADPGYRTNADRVARRGELVEAVATLMRGRTTRQWLDLLGAAEVPCGPINDLAQVFDDPQVRHRGLRLDLPHALAGSAPGVRNPVRFSRSAVEYERAPPTLGADTAAVLEARLGLDAAAVAELAARGVIA